MGAPWKPGAAEPPRVDDVNRGLVNRPGITGQPHSDSVKRHLDGYDVETSLNEVCIFAHPQRWAPSGTSSISSVLCADSRFQIIDVTTRTLDFSRHYAAKAHQTQRSGPVPGSLPSLNEIDDLLQLQRRCQDALLRIRSAVLSQEHALAEQRAQRQAYKSEGGYDDEQHVGMYPDEFKGGGGFAGSDVKKRRGVGSIQHSIFPV